MKDKPQIHEKEFNSGLSLIYQLDGIEKGLINATIENDFHLHYRMLIAYFKTLCNQTNDKEEAKQIKNWETVREAYNKLCLYERKGQKKVPQELLEVFDWWEIELRNLKQHYGLGMKKKDMRYQMG